MSTSSSLSALSSASFTARFCSHHKHIREMFSNAECSHRKAWSDALLRCTGTDIEQRCHTADFCLSWAAMETPC